MFPVKVLWTERQWEELPEGACGDFTLGVVGTRVRVSGPARVDHEDGRAVRAELADELPADPAW